MCCKEVLPDLLVKLFCLLLQFLCQIPPQLGPPVQQQAIDVEERKAHTCMLETHYVSVLQH